MAALSNFAADVRKALYTSPANLSVDGVIFARVVRRQGSEGLLESARTRDGTMVLETIVKFWEEATA